MRTCSQSWLFSLSLAVAADTCAATSSLLERSADASSPTCHRHSRLLGGGRHLDMSRLYRQSVSNPAQHTEADEHRGIHCRAGITLCNADNRSGLSHHRERMLSANAMPGSQGAWPALLLQPSAASTGPSLRAGLPGLLPEQPPAQQPCPHQVFGGMSAHRQSCGSVDA